MFNQLKIVSTGEKPFKCRFCSYAFTQSHTRSYHEKAKHGISKDNVGSFNQGAHVPKGIETLTELN